MVCPSVPSVAVSQPPLPKRQPYLSIINYQLKKLRYLSRHHHLNTLSLLQNKNKMERIRYSGLSLTPDEQLVDNGEMSLCANMETHNGAMRPAVIAGSTIANPLLMQDEKTPVQLFYVHQTTAYRHYIGQAKRTQQALFWFYQDGTRGDVIKTFGADVEITDINSVGNTIIICATDGMHYARWMPNEGTYKYIGQKPPFVHLSFSMDGPKEIEYEIPKEINKNNFSKTKTAKTVAFRVAEQLKPTDVFKIGAKEDMPGKVNIVEEYQAQVTEETWALINKTHAKIAEEGYFYAPFFIRYCYRMYDGSMMMHSAPIFIPTKMSKPTIIKTLNVNLNSNAEWEIINKHFRIIIGDTLFASDTDDKTIFYYEPYCGALKWKVLNGGTWTKIQEDWKDVIQSLDIFITPPITELESAKLIQTLSLEKTCTIYYNGYTKVARFDPLAVTSAAFDISSLSQKAFYDKISNQAAFFRLKSISTDKDIPTTLTEMDVDKTVVRYITTQEQMKDDYKTHNKLYAKGMFVYNRRVNAYGLKEQLFKGFNSFTLMPDNYCDYLTAKREGLPEPTKGAEIQKVAVILNTEDGQKMVALTEMNNRYIGLIMLLNSPLFYPDSRAVKMILKYKAYNNASNKWLDYVVERDMAPCNELNGAITIMGDFMSINPTAEYRRQIYTFDFTAIDDIVDMPSKIYTSEINNPYLFPVNGINTVGTGEIIGLAAATRALSQGQFGQFPLMAFTSDGVWALSVSSTGTYAAINPISREVCTNERSITPIDQSVVFVTDRAINRIRESDVVRFSDKIDGPYFNIQNKLPQLYNWMSEHMTALLAAIEYNHSPIDAFQTAQILYDYTNQRILVFPDITAQQTIVFTYSIQSDSWALIIANEEAKTILALPSEDSLDNTPPNNDTPNNDSTDNDNTDNDNSDPDTNTETPDPENEGGEVDPDDGGGDGQEPGDGEDDGGGQEVDPSDPEDPEPEEPVDPSDPSDPDEPYIIIDGGEEPEPERPEPDDPDQPYDPGEPAYEYIVCEQCGASILADPGYPCPVCGYNPEGTPDPDDPDPSGDDPDPSGGGDDPSGDDPDPSGGGDDDEQPTPPLLNVLNGYPYPWMQLADGTVLRLDIPYSRLYNNAEVHQGVILSRTLKFAEMMLAVTAYCQESDMSQQPTLFFFGSNDNVNWRYIGRTNRRKADYIPAHSYRYFRMAVVFDSMKTSELYYETQIEIKDKYQKTT